MAHGRLEKKWLTTLASLASVVVLSSGTSTARAEEALPEARRLSPVLAYGVWFLAELVPSPLLVVGDEHVGSGMRWQVTPLLYSFGIAERPFRTFIVSPIARHSGSVELHASPEWACCAPNDGTSWLLRAGLRLYLPIIEHGEVLSWSVGGTYFRGETGGFGGDLGIYTLSGVIGVNVTVAPELERREVVTALTIRYF